MAKQAVKLSEYPKTPANERGEILYDSFFYTYANTNYGATYLRKNYQLPLSTLRDDIRYYIGVDNTGIKMLHLWWGNWSDSDRNYSYIYEWDIIDSRLPEYVKDKFGHDKTPQNPTNTFILRTAPLPGDENIDVYENTVFSDQILRNKQTKGSDPNTKTTKIVTKDYIDERFKGFRKLYVNSSIKDVAKQYAGIWNANLNTLLIRPYTCYYVFDEIIRAKNGSENPIINIIDENYSTLKNVFGQKLTFYVCVKDVEDYYKARPIIFKLDNEECNIVWNYEEEWEELYSKQQKDANGYYTIRFELEITKNDITQSSVPYRYVARAYSETQKTFLQDGNSRALIPLTPSLVSNPTQGETYNISFGDVNEKNDYFINLVGVSTGVIISFDVGEFGTPHQGKTYEWNVYIQTGNSVPVVNFGGDNDEIFWMLEDSVSYQPILQENKLYCLSFTKVLNQNGNEFETKLLGRIKSYVNLVKPPTVDYTVITSSANQSVSAITTNSSGDETPNYNCKISWGDSSSKEVFYNGMNIPNHTYQRAGTYVITVSGRFDGLTGFA